LAQWMQLVAGYGPIETGVRLLPVAVAAVVASLAAPWLANVLGARVVLAGGLVAAAIGMVLIAAPAQLDYVGLLAPL
ncbi:MFS transporter, partial [Mycobacterium kansasii]